jgi:DNA-binding FadR family transcriptional regulator
MLIAIPVLPVNIEHSGAQHRIIVDAILAGDGGRARRTMESLRRHRGPTPRAAVMIEQSSAVGEVR